MHCFYTHNVRPVVLGRPYLSPRARSCLGVVSAPLPLSPDHASQPHPLTGIATTPDSADPPVK